MRRTNRIEEQAAEWLAHLARPAVGADEHAAFDRWLAVDPKHIAAYERLEAAWQRLNRLQSFGCQRTAARNIHSFPLPVPRQRSPLSTLLWQRTTAIGFKALGVLRPGLHRNKNR